MTSISTTSGATIQPTISSTIPSPALDPILDPNNTDLVSMYDGSVSGTTLLDATTNGLNGVINNVFVTPGIISDALDFPGGAPAAGNDTGTVIFPDSTAYNNYNANGITLSAHIKMDSLNFAIYTKANSSSGRSFYMAVNASGFLDCLMSSSGNYEAANNVIGSAVLSTGVWYHVAFVWTPGVSVECFVDGVSDGIKTTGIASTMADTTTTVRLGDAFDNIGLAPHANGLMEQVRNFKIAASQSEITTLANEV